MLNPDFPLLSGSIQLTSDEGLIKEALFGSYMNQCTVVNLDEDIVLPADHPHLIAGLCLLPPVDALIAEADGDENNFYRIYNEHFDTPLVKEFMSALIIYLHRGGQLLMFHHDIESTVIRTLSNLLEQRYGIWMGVILVRPCAYDTIFAPVWIWILYYGGCLSPEDVLFRWPLEQDMYPQMIDDLLLDLHIYGGDYHTKIKYLKQLAFKYKKKPDLKIPIRSVD